MGLNVNDDEEYQLYSEGMMPILRSFGASFGFDFKVSEVLLSKRHFVNSVTSKTIISMHEKHA